MPSRASSLRLKRTTSVWKPLALPKPTSCSGLHKAIEVFPRVTTKSKVVQTYMSPTNKTLFGSVMLYFATMTSRSAAPGFPKTTALRWDASSKRLTKAPGPKINIRYKICYNVKTPSRNTRTQHWLVRRQVCIRYSCNKLAFGIVQQGTCPIKVFDW